MNEESKQKAFKKLMKDSGMTCSWIELTYL